MKTCKCGCKTFVKSLDKKGRKRFYIKGHANKNRFFSKKWRKNIGKAKTGIKQSKETKEKRGIYKKEKEHHSWKGNNIGYRALHIWVENKLGKLRFCENCGNRDLKHRQYHWSNIDGHYKRIITDWRRLCVKCHKAYDKQIKLNQEKN